MTRANSPNRQIKYGIKHGRFIDNDKYPLDEAACGTLKNYRAHQRRGQKPCRRCEAAHVRFREDHYER